MDDMITEDLEEELVEKFEYKQREANTKDWTKVLYSIRNFLFLAFSVDASYPVEFYCKLLGFEEVQSWWYELSMDQKKLFCNVLLESLK